MKRHLGSCRRLLALVHDDSGQMAIMMVPTLLVICMFFALGLDAGLWYFDHRWAQTEAEASAAAGVVSLPNVSRAPADAASDRWLVRNGSVAAADAICPRSGVGNGRIVTDADGDGRYDTVAVCVRRSRTSLFSFLSGVGSVYVSAGAKATVVEEPAPYSLMAMNETMCSALELDGGARVRVTGGGGTYTRSSCSTGQGALSVTGTSNLDTTPGVNDVFFLGSAPGNEVPAATAQGYLEDPFESLPQPPVTPGNCALTSAQSGNPPAILSPGTYCYELRIGNPTTLRPGVYILEAGLTMSGQGRLTGDENGNAVLDPNEEVLLYSTCPNPPRGPATQCNGREAGSLLFGGQSPVNIRGRSDMREMAIWVDRTSGPGSVVRFRGGSVGGLEGRLYAYSSTVDIGGNPGVSLTLNMSIVADVITFQGTADLSMPYDPILAPVLLNMSITE